MARRIDPRRTPLLDRHDWTWEDLADLLHGTPPEHLHLPPPLDPTQPPRLDPRPHHRRHPPPSHHATYASCCNIERGSDLLRQQRETEQHDAARAEIAARRAAIDTRRVLQRARLVRPRRRRTDSPQVRCSHDPDTGGWWAESRKI